MSRRLAGLEQYVGIKERLGYKGEVHRKILVNIANMIAWKNSFVLDNMDRWEKNRRIYFNIMTAREEAEDKDKEKLGQLGNLILPVSYKVVKTILDVATEELEKRRYYYELLPFYSKDYAKVLFLNLLLQNNLKKQNYLMLLKQLLEDAMIYGCGILHISWGRLYESSYIETQIEGDRLLDIPTRKVIEKRTRFAYEGNILNVINPAMFDFDKSFGILDIDKWRYCIIKLLIGVDDLVEQVSGGENFINVDVLKEMARSKTFNELILPLVTSTNVPLSADESSDLQLWWGQGKKVLVESIYMKLIPSRFGLGDSDDMEIWLFTVVNRRLVIKASPLTYAHNKFPIAIYTWNGSYNERYPAALMDYLEPLQSYVDWLLRKYKENVNGSVNRMFLVDRSKLKNPEDFAFDRALSILFVDEVAARRPGFSMDSVVKELNFDLKTSAHLNVLPLFMDIIRNIGGLSELYMGAFPRGRRTKAEVAMQVTLSSAGIRSLLRNIHNILGHRLVTLMTSNLRQFLQGDLLIELREDEFNEVKKLSDVARNLMVLETITGRRLLNLDTSIVKGDYDYYLGDYLEPAYDEKTLQAISNFLQVSGNIPLVGNILALLLKWDKVTELLFRAVGSKNPEEFLNMDVVGQIPQIVMGMMQQKNKEEGSGGQG